MADLLAELLERCRSGDDSAYRTIVKRFQNKAFDLAKAILRDKHLAEDAVQEAFLSAFSKLSQLREPKAFPGWFRQIVRTEARRIILKKNKLSNDVKQEKNTELSPIERAELEELRKIVRQALKELPQTSRQTAELFYMDERSYIDIAQILDVPRGTVKSRLYEARQRLRNILLGYVKETVTKKEKKKKYDKQMPL